MRKILIVIFLSLTSCNIVFAESYYFKACKLTDVLYGNYVIDLDKKVIRVVLEAINGTTQEFEDKIKSIKKNQIVSEKIESKTGKDIYFQYFLNSKSKSITKLQYKKESGTDMDMFRLIGKKVKSYCENVKGGWSISKKKDSEKSKKPKELTVKIESSISKCLGNDRKQWTGCMGSFTNKDGYKYIGQFVSGKILKGTAIYLGGAKYAGEFKDYKPHGFGTFVWSSGDKYSGQWKDGKAHGDGTKTWNGGRKYSGKFKNDKLHGNGTLIYSDGKKYVGEFINGKRHGEGTFTYADGTAYIGQFIEGHEQGEGECISKDGSSIKCGSRTDTQTQDFSGKNTRNISIIAKKWVRISQYETNTKKGKKIMDKLKMDFEAKAIEACASTGNFNVLQKEIEIIETNDTPAYGLETKLKLGIKGVVACI